jgi:hypothetical protein
LAAFILSLLGLFTFGIAIIPALICALISKRQAEADGVSPDGFATAAIVVSGFVLFLGTAVIFGFGAAVGSGTFQLPQISNSTLQALLVGTGAGILVISALLVAHSRTSRRSERARLRQLSGRGFSSRKTLGTRRRRATVRAEW